MTQTQAIPISRPLTPPHGPAEVQASRLRWLMRVRWLYVGGIAALAVAVSFWKPHWPAVCLLSSLAVIMLAYNLLFTAMTGRCVRRENAKATNSLSVLTAAQIALDLLALMCLMHLTGGAYNLLLAVVVFHLAVAASLQSRSAARHEATLALGLFVALVLVEGLGQRPPLLGGFMGTAPMGIDGSGPSLILSLAMSFLIAGGCFWGTVYFTFAILERLRGINRRLVEANRELSGLDLAKSRFLRVSSHQLRGPLAAIHTLVSATEEVGGFNPKQHELMQKIHTRSDEMMTQLDEMLVLSTIKERASETVAGGSVNVCQVVQESVGAFAEEAKQKGLSLTSSCGGKALVWAWEDAFETVLEHLLSNAMHYTPSGGSVSVQTMPGEKSVDVEVADTGIGIPAEQQDRLFHEFSRATNARQVCGGTGLGLSIVKATVERLGGTISIASAPGQGTKVSLTLPLEEGTRQ